MLRALRAFVVAALITTGAIQAAEPVTIGTIETLHSAILDEERTLMVHLPAGYAASETTYPVVYLLDARTRFGHTTGTLEALARTGHLPEMIVVAVANTDRTRDLTPAWTGKPPEAGSMPDGRLQAVAAGGGAEAFLAFFRDELIPHVEATYRAAPFRVLVGHSFGGLFAVHAFVTDPDLFQAHVAISPSLWWDGGRPVEQAKTLFATQPELDGHLYLTLANEGGDMAAKFHEMATLLRYRAPPALAWHARVLDGEDHGSIPMPAVYGGFRALFPRWQLPAFTQTEGLTAVDAHYAGLSSQYGYAIETPEAVINNLGYQLLGSDQTDDAIATFRTNVERFPGSANVYDSLGEAVEAAGELEEAMRLYAKACDLGKRNADPNLTAYDQHRIAVREKLDEAKR